MAASKVQARPDPELDRLLRAAIADKRLVTFLLDGRPRRAEPHDYGLKDGEPRLFFYQVGGQSRSGRPLGWRWAVISKVSDLRILDQHFAGTRPVPTGRHVEWDTLFASVSPRPRPPRKG